jgi:hypothetical protein
MSLDTQADLWRRTLGVLQATTVAGTFERWLRSSRLVDVDAGRWTVAVRDETGLDWLNDRYMPAVARAARAATGRDVTIHFIAEADLVPTREKEDDTAPVLEAVREQRVAVARDGVAFSHDDYYIKLKLAFRRRALKELQGAPLAVFLCLALHLDADGIAHPGLDRICEETGYSRPTVCSALDKLSHMRLIDQLPRSTGAVSRYRVSGYAWFGAAPAHNVLEEPPTPGG